MEESLIWPEIVTGLFSLVITFGAIRLQRYYDKKDNKELKELKKVVKELRKKLKKKKNIKLPELSSNSRNPGFDWEEEVMVREEKKHDTPISELIEKLENIILREESEILSWVIYILSFLIGVLLALNFSLKWIFIVSIALLVLISFRKIYRIQRLENRGFFFSIYVVIILSAGFFGKFLMEQFL